MRNSKGSMVLGGIEKEAVKIYFQEKKKSRLKKLLGFHFGLISILLLFSYLTGDYNLLLLGAIFSTITITADSATQFESGGAEYDAVARLDDNTFVIAFRDINDNNKGKAIIGTREGTTISIVEDSATVFESGETDSIDICKLSTDKFAITYRDVTDSNIPKMIMGIVSEATITLGEIKTIGAINNTEGTGICALNSSYIVVSYSTNAQTHYKIGNISGDTITWGAVFNQTSNYGEVAFKMDNFDDVYCLTAFKYEEDTKILVLKADKTNKTLTTNGGVKIQDNGSNNFYDVDVSCFNDIYFIVSWRDNVNKGRVIIGSISGASVTMGSSVIFNDADTSYISVASMDSTHFVVSYKDEGNTNKGMVRGGSISGTVLTFDSDGEVLFESDATNYTSICKLSSNYFVVSFKHGV